MFHQAFKSIAQEAKIVTQKGVQNVKQNMSFSLKAERNGKKKKKETKRIITK